MNQKTLDQEWQQLQAHVTGFVSRVLSNNMQKIEYNPKFIGQFLEMPFKHYEDKQAMTAISDSFSEKGEGEGEKTW